MTQPNSTNSTWTDERVATLKKLWLEGHSAGQIARTLGGTTRNAVIGVVYRLGLQRSAALTPAAAQERARVMRDAQAKRRLTLGTINREPRPVRAPKPPKAEPVEPRVRGADGRLLPLKPAARDDLPGMATILDLSAHTCRWPIGDPKDDAFSFCGRLCGSGPYCRVHAREAFRQESDAKRQRKVKELGRLLARFA